MAVRVRQAQRKAWKDVVAGSRDAEFVTEIDFGATLKLGDIAVGNIWVMQKIACREFEGIESVGKMGAPVNRHVSERASSSNSW